MVLNIIEKFGWKSNLNLSFEVPETNEEKQEVMDTTTMPKETVSSSFFWAASKVTTKEEKIFFMSVLDSEITSVRGS